jgi:hypothetical protein
MNPRQVYIGNDVHDGSLRESSYEQQLPRHRIIPRTESMRKDYARRSSLHLNNNLDEKEDLLHFEQLIRNLIESEHVDLFQEYRKQIFHNLNIISDQEFILDVHSLEKLSLLALAGSRNTQSVYADVLKCALAPIKSSKKKRYLVLSNNKSIFFTESTGRRLLIRLIDAFWEKAKSNDFCDEALEIISSDIFELVSKSFFLLFLSFSHTHVPL